MAEAVVLADMQTDTQVPRPAQAGPGGMEVVGGLRQGTMDGSIRG